MVTQQRACIYSVFCLGRDLLISFQARQHWSSIVSSKLTGWCESIRLSDEGNKLFGGDLSMYKGGHITATSDEGHVLKTILM